MSIVVIVGCEAMATAQALLGLLQSVPTAAVTAAPPVDPFIGTTRGCNTWPGATAPFGMIAWSPTDTAGDQTTAPGGNGYDYNATRLRGFSLLFVFGVGCALGAAGVFSFLL